MSLPTRNKEMKGLQTSLLALVFCFIIQQRIDAQISAPKSIIGNGGGELSGGSYKGVVTVGQSIVGVVSSSSFDSGMGFWVLIVIKRPQTGTDGVLQATYVIQALANPSGMQDTLRIRVTDPDLNSDDTQKNIASVKIQNATSGEVENILLEETDEQSGIFHGRIPTVNGVAGTDNDGILTIASWDTIFVQYSDNLTATGSPDTLQTQTFVVNLFGDMSGNGNVRAYDAYPILGIVIGRQAASFRDSLVADVSGNNSIRAFDASLILQYVIGKLSRFPVQVDTTFESSIDLKNHPFLE